MTLAGTCIGIRVYAFDASLVNHYLYVLYKMKIIDLLECIYLKGLPTPPCLLYTFQFF